MANVWQAISQDRQSQDGATAAYSVLLFLGLGVGAVVAGVYLRRELKAAGPGPRPTDPGELRRWKSGRFFGKAAPYFLMFWGVMFFIGGVVQAVRAVVGAQQLLLRGPGAGERPRARATLRERVPSASTAGCARSAARPRGPGCVRPQARGVSRSGPVHENRGGPAESQGLGPVTPPGPQVMVCR